jgi:hypothetical protein
MPSMLVLSISQMGQEFSHISPWSLLSNISPWWNKAFRQGIALTLSSNCSSVTRQDHIKTDVKDIYLIKQTLLDSRLGPLPIRQHIDMAFAVAPVDDIA